MTKFHSLTTIKLRGKKVTAAVLKAFSKSLGQSNLREIILADGSGHVKGSDNNLHQEIGNLIKCAPLLQVLSVPRGFPFHVLKTAVREARNGGDSLITTLVWPDTYLSSSFQDLVAFGSIFPEIVSLDIGGVSPAAFEAGVNICAMPRLRTLKISSLIRLIGGVHMSTETLGTFVSNLLRACPILEHLDISHGLLTHTSTHTHNW